MKPLSDLPYLIDAHCHLDYFLAELDEVIQRAIKVGVQRYLVPSTTLAAIPNVCLLREKWPVWIGLGLHPYFIEMHQQISFNQLMATLSHKIEHIRPEAIGEIGLDGAMPANTHAFQKDLFIAQLKLAKHYDLPVIVHSRGAQDLVLSLLRQQGVTRGMIHAFSGSLQQAEGFIKQGFLLG
ncbi:MAG: TatD family hydrolase, partial [Neisseriaceae bacterium]|nr:TatD family hydrolase [Neisseriaceae bacterium]